VNRNTYLLVIGALLAASAITAYYLNSRSAVSTVIESADRGSSSAMMGAAESDQEDLDYRPSEADSLQSERSRLNGLANLKRRFNTDLDPMIALVQMKGEITDEDIAEYNQLHVLPYGKPNIQRSCVRTPDPVYEGLDSIECESTDLNPPHPYTVIEIAELEELAYSDPVAAVFLGQRTEDPSAKLKSYLRASALSGKSGPIKILAERHYFASHVTQVVGGEWLEEPQVGVAVVRLALEHVADRMSDPRANPDTWESKVAEIGGDNAAELVETSLKLSERFLSEMAEIQTEVTGSSQIRELIDA